MSDESANSAWMNAMIAVGRIGDRFAAEIEARGNRVRRDEIVHTLLGVLMDTYLTRIAVDPNKPTFVPCSGFFQKVGYPNPDTVYRATPVDPQGIYRLTGERGDARDVTMMPFTSAMRSSEPFDLTGVSNEGVGEFDLILSGAKPQGYTGDWWQLQPDTASLWLREVSDKWGEERAVRISIVRLDPPVHSQPEHRDLERQLVALTARIESIIEHGILHADELVDQGFVNSLKQIDYSTSGAMPLQFYHEAVFDIPDDQCLLIECRMPADCQYFSWSTTDCMMVTQDWMNAFTSLNSEQAKIDPDGVLRVIVSRTDPEAPNWMETLGHRYGVLQLRSIGSEIAPAFTLKIVSRDAVFDHLPEGTDRVDAEERLSRLHKRQRSCQMRRLW